VGVSARESRAILDLLYAELTKPEYTVRFRWEPGSVAFWDNRATAHLAPSDIDHLDLRRTLHRVTLVGDVPVGPTGGSPSWWPGSPSPPGTRSWSATDRLIAAAAARAGLWQDGGGRRGTST
jgi:alpha-ketoglutarate-dependent sulfate ester dioxygenase